MREPKTKELDGVSFTLRPLPGMKAVKMQARLTRVLGPALAALAGSKDGLDANALKEALGSLGERLTENEYEGLVRTMLEGSTFQPMDGTPGGELLPQFDLVMQGRSELVPQLLLAAIEVNYSGFFPILRSLALTAGKRESPSAGLMNSPKSGPAGV